MSRLPALSFWRFVSRKSFDVLADHNNVVCQSSSSRKREQLYGLLTRHGDTDGVLRRDEVIEALSILGNGELDALDVT